MSIFVAIVLCIFVCIGALLLKNYSPSIGFILTISLSVILFIICFPKLNSIIHTLSNISAKAGIESNLFIILIKCLGITYISDFGENICKDAGQNALSTKILLFGKIGVVIIILPIIEDILNNVIAIIK